MSFAKNHKTRDPVFQAPNRARAKFCLTKKNNILRAWPFLFSSIYCWHYCSLQFRADQLSFGEIEGQNNRSPQTQWAISQALQSGSCLYLPWPSNNVRILAGYSMSNIMSDNLPSCHKFHYFKWTSNSLEVEQSTKNMALKQSIIVISAQANTQERVTRCERSILAINKIGLPTKPANREVNNQQIFKRSRSTQSLSNIIRLIHCHLCH